MFADVRGKYAGGCEWSLGQTRTLETAQCFISFPTVALLLLKWLLIKANYNEEPAELGIMVYSSTVIPAESLCVLV